MLVYDVEIKKAILGRGEKPTEGVEYCDGWNDHANMGVSTVCCYDYEEDRYRVFCSDNLEEFSALVDAHDIIVSFNGLNFDNKVLAYAIPGLVEPLKWLNKKSYDIFAEIRDVSGKWCGLDAIIKARQVRQWSPGPCVVSDRAMGFVDRLLPRRRETHKKVA
jgi:hypothetical protein